MRDFTNTLDILILDLSLMLLIYFRLYSEAIKTLRTMIMTLKEVEIILRSMARMDKKENKKKEFNMHFKKNLKGTKH